MKYTALLNLAGIHDAGLSDKTDVVDWVIIEYIADWYTAPGVTRRDDKVWINYRHLIAELPLLGLKTKSSVSRRITNLSELGLLNIVHDQDGRLYASIGQAAIDARCFRQARLPESTGVYENQRGVDENQRGGVYQNQHSLDNHILLDDQISKDKQAPPIGSDPVIQPQPSLPAKRKKASNPIFSPALMDIPEWLDREVWAMWCEEREAKRKPITYRAGQLQLKKLAEYRDQGFSPQDVIEHSIASGYQGLFPPRGNQHENRRSNSNGFNAIDPNDDSWLTDDALAYIESGREIGNRVRAGKPLLRRDDDGVYRLATGDDG